MVEFDVDAENVGRRRESFSLSLGLSCSGGVAEKRVAT